LCYHLGKHSEIFFSKPKELMFFHKEGLTEQDFQVYLATHFSTAAAETYVAEGSTVYFQFPKALDNILRFLGNELRVIVCLRHPCERAISFYLHNYKRGRFTGRESILEETRLKQLSPIHTGFYAKHARRWIEAIGRDRIHFILFDQLLCDPYQFVREATDFLGLVSLTSVQDRRINAGYGFSLEADHLVPEVDPATLLENQTVPRFPLAELETLQQLFQSDIERTASLIGIDLSAWLQLPVFEVEG